MPLQGGDVLRVAARCKGPQSQDIVNVYHYQAENDISADDEFILDVISLALSSAYNYIQSWIPATQTPYDIKVDVVRLADGQEEVVRNVGVVPWNPLFDPSGSGNVYAPGVAVGVLLRTLVSRVFARKFIGVLMEAALGDHGKLDNAAVPAFIQFASAIASHIDANGDRLIPGVLSKAVGGFLKTVAWELATEAFYQRRRNVRRGS